MGASGDERPDLRGIWGFPVTPFRDGSVDLGLLAELCERQLEGGVDVLCACGAIAQGELLTPAERRQSMWVVARAAAGRLPSVLALPADGDAAALASEAEAAGVSGLLVMPSTSESAAIASCLAGIAEAAPGLSLVLYHRPPLLLEPEGLRSLVEHGLIAGLKDGHRDVRLFRRLHGAVEADLLWVSAWEDVAVPFWSLGCNAFAPASTAYAPAYARAWLTLLEAGDIDGASSLLAAHAYPMVDLRLSRPRIEITTVKAAMAACGISAGETRPPAEALTTAEREGVGRLVSALQRALGELSAASGARA